VNALVGDPARNPGVDDVDHAADGRRAEQQGGGTAKHLDPVGGERVDGDRMVDAGVGRVEASDAVGQHPHPFALEASEHRPRGVGPERGRRDPGLAGEGLADRRPELARELGARHHRGAGEHVVAVAPEAGDDDVLGMVGMRIVGRRFRSGGGGSRLGRGLGGRILGKGDIGKQGRDGSG
jgi:hypothetical protein